MSQATVSRLTPIPLQHFHPTRTYQASMKSCIGFVGLLASGSCGSHISSRTRADTTTRTLCKSYPHHSAISIRGGGGESSSSTQLNLSATATMASLFAGSIAGSLGVGVAYPFDTLSTKAQVSSGNAEGTEGKQINFVQNIRTIWINEGIQGFFEGVFVTMIGQAAIKSIQFAVNEITLLYLETNASLQSNVLKMAIAGTLAGLLSSFVVSPIELVKIRMQAQNKSIPKENDESSKVYSNDYECAKYLIKHEGWRALFFHGLGITIMREIPSFAFYFVAYGILARSSLAAVLGNHAAPLIFGAAAGWAMWIPTYPADIVKTLVQVQDSNSKISLRQITAKLYRSGGVKAFFDGLEPKLVRAAIKHAVTFWVYEIVMNVLRPRI